MFPQLLLAPPAQGKTAYVLNLARETAVSQLTEIRICVPTALQARAWRERLAAAGGAIGIHILIFDDLVTACLNEAGQTYTKLSDPVQYRLLRQVIEQQPLSHYAALKAKPGFIQVVQRLITELKASRIYPADLAQAVSQLDGEPRLRELADIYTAYQTHLQAQGWADRMGLHWLAVEALTDHAPAACRHWPLLIVDGFDDFTPIQLALLQLLAQRVGEFIITLPHSETAVYPRYQRTRREVEQALGISGRLLPATPLAVDPSLHHLAQHLFVLDGRAAAANGEALTLCEAPDPASEVRAALRWLKQRIVWEGMSPNQVALLARDISMYRPFISQIAAEFGLPIRLVDGQPLPQSPVIAALLNLLRLHLPTGGEPGLPRRQLLSTWRSPYFDWGEGETAVTATAADSLDTFARQQRVIGGLGQWQAAFAIGVAAEARDIPVEIEEGEEQLLPRTAVSHLQQIFNRFLTLTQPPAAASTTHHFVQWLETLIGADPRTEREQPVTDGSLHMVAQVRQNPPTAAADLAALQTLKEILRSLVWAEEAAVPSQPVDFPAFFAELAGAVAATQFHLPPQPHQPEILVANVNQVRGISFAAAAIMGLSEGLFPAAISEDSFLRDADRHILRQQFGLALNPSTQSAEREFFYEAVTRARHKLLLTRPVLADNGAEWVASPFWEAVSQLVPVVAPPLASEAILPLGETASWAEWWETIAADSAGAVVAHTRDAAIWQQIELGAHIWRVRQQGETAVYHGDLAPLANDLTARFGPDHMWSASRLEAYQTCGFLFFWQNVLQLAPRLEPAEGLDVGQLGRIYHDIFEKVMGAGLPEPPTETAVYQHVSTIATPILNRAPEREGFRETPWWSQTRQEIIENVARSLLALAEGEFGFIQAEAAFGIKQPPLVITEGGDRLQLRGFIDRIDRNVAGGLRLIDYKSGGKSAYTPTAFAQGKKLQLPLYALAAQAALGLGTVAEGFYWHLQQAEASSFALSKVGVEAAIETAVAYAWQAVRHIRTGHFTPRPPDGGCPTYCPAAACCWQYTPQGW
ncbi:MAG: exodeoxyribonuclease V subunit gamma [Ardenticatenaceae bacterium]|nr:exodeoxyribonuclease V subunit gamma [Ardenticatenaceae bacterium]